MASKEKQSKNNSSIIPAETFRHVRINPITGEADYFFILEIIDPSIRALAQERGLEIGKTRLGNRVFEAVTKALGCWLF